LTFTPGRIKIGKKSSEKDMDMSIKGELLQIAKESKKAAQVLANLSSEEKNRALQKMALELEKNTQKIKEENKKDIEVAKEKGLSAALIDRLT